MSNYERSFVNGKPTEAFKRRSAIYEINLSNDSQNKYRVKSLAERALKEMQKKTRQHEDSTELDHA